MHLEGSSGPPRWLETARMRQTPLLFDTACSAENMPKTQRVSSPGAACKEYLPHPPPKRELNPQTNWGATWSQHQASKILSPV